MKSKSITMRILAGKNELLNILRNEIGEIINYRTGKMDRDRLSTSELREIRLFAFSPILGIRRYGFDF